VAYPIIDEFTGLWIVLEGQLTAAGDPAAAVLFEPSDSLMFYEVVRVTRGVPLFWEDHMARLQASVQGQIKIPDTLYDESCRLIAANAISEANLRLVITSARHVVHLTQSYYPSDELRSSGVPTGVLAWERTDPNTKVIRGDYKVAVAERFARPGPFGRCFELLLADRQGCLTEGSRSNLFFIRRDQVLSAPDDRILLGITRKYVRQAITAAGLTYAEGLLTLEDIGGGACDAAFLTGSPIDVLPISAIEDIALPSAANANMQKLMAAYQNIVDNYLAVRQQHSGGIT
jgi:branched-chain amino acid aminotransferase